jgi:glutamate-1-semialdehyde 2,1-aminomutase
MARKAYDLSKSYTMLERAEQVVPGGVYGVRSVRFAVYGKYPQFIREGRGSRLIDVDGNEYVDYISAFGSILLGYRHPRVEGAVREQAERGNAFSFPSDRWLELAERLVERVDVADWVVFGKNGSDVTDYALRLVRAYTGRKTILVGAGAYHTFQPWGVPLPVGVPEAWRSHVDDFRFGDVDSLEQVFARHRGDVAGVMVSPFKHDAFHDQEIPSRTYTDALREICDREGALLVLDDIRAGFRCHPTGLSHLAFGYQPDVICYGKAIGNGHPISVLVGTEALREAASRLYFSATHFFSAEPMAAALATITAFDDEKAFAHMSQAGKALCAGLEERANAAGFRVRITGPPTMPFLRFEDDPQFELARKWCGEMALRGVLVHPVHNWFVSAAISDDDLVRSLDVAEECFALTRADRA